jgi:tetratricopeptide (TPR) repeat protein
MIKHLCHLLAAAALLCCGTALVPELRAAPSPAAFEAANKLYYENKFPDAIAAYRQILATGGDTTALRFNLGNAYFKAGQLGRAIASYRLAESWAPRDPDIRANLHFARKQVTGSTWTWNRLERAVLKLTLDEWTLLFAALFWLCLILLALEQWKPELKRSTRSPLVAAAPLLLAIGLCLAESWNLGPSLQLAVVTVPDLSVRHAPIPESPQTFILHDGAEVRILGHRNDWLQIALNTGQVGWVHEDKVLVEHMARWRTKLQLEILRTRTGF